jgi:hypothetical protein
MFSHHQTIIVGIAHSVLDLCLARIVMRFFGC